MKNTNIAFTLNPGEVHIWRAALNKFTHRIDTYRELLANDELARADRFHFPVHQQRFAVARGILRQILSFYLHTKPQDLHFSYQDKGKPFIENLPLQFNLSHSHDYAVYAITKESEVGIDIEKIEDHYNDDVAERFFSIGEYAQLQKLPEEKRIQAFYEIWARKEAIIKTFGEGLTLPLKSFTVALQKTNEEIVLPNGRLFLKSFSVHPNYAAAFATTTPMENVFHWEWDED